MAYTTQVFNVHNLWCFEHNKPTIRRRRGPRGNQQPPAIFFNAIDIMISTMLAIGKAAANFKPPFNTQSDTFNHLLNHLGLFYDGITHWTTGFKGNRTIYREHRHGPRLRTIDAALEELRTTILEEQPNLDLEKKEWKIATVSALWLLLDLRYESIQRRPTYLGEDRLDWFQGQVLEQLELKLPKKPTPNFTLGTGLPATIFVCAVEEGMVWGECKMQWYPFDSVTNEFRKMRLCRLGGKKCRLFDQSTKLKAIEEASRGTAGNPGGQTRKANAANFKRLLTERGWTPFDHRQEPGIAYRVGYGDAEKRFRRRVPCLKCSHLFNWGIQINGPSDKNFFEIMNCAEDDVHMQLEHRRQQSGQKRQTTNNTPSPNNKEGQTSSPTTVTDT
ncbi:hypothetical protein AYO20_09791 [Fonsecaea nubica]|uniref:Uncharacterized protein n=1 Tax=Fonsecaea nubica TaxID=856822 RepID=A0A178CBV9_9EURO|nr:hypothetical protein AYO20_09791 [Fonsecaea nubica]OAL27440.1 hypothetical protein AYO20_09791 [Fonsecaea nubica]